MKAETRIRGLITILAAMEIYHWVLYCGLVTTAASFSVPDAIAENTNGSPILGSESRTCNCENGSCVADKLGHWKCVCKPGFALQDEFTCKPCDCGSLGKCIFILKVTEGNKYHYQKKCVCDVGKAEKEGICVDCFCGENSACDFDYGERRCYCIEGYSEKDGVCTKCDCGFYGECEYKDGNKKCECDDGYLELDGTCEECDCGNHGTCLFENGQKTCKCQTGFSVNNGKCVPCDCGSNSENCVFVDGLKQCKCNDRYADRYGTCEECYCGESTRNCNFMDNQKTCNCLEGYVQKGETCELGCSDKHPCQHGGFCKGGFCFCLNGTRGEFCEVIDECSNLCPNKRDTSCAYDVTSKKAYCQCLDDNLSYYPDMKQCRKTCVTEEWCKNGGTCEQSDRVKFCKCSEGSVGDFCEEIPACDNMDCGTEAQCKYNVTESKATCVCSKDLFFDARNKKCKRTCADDKSCKNRGKCVGTSYLKFCDCLKGTTGDFCEEISECSGIDCGSNAYCVLNPSTKKAGCACKNPSLHYDSSIRSCRRICNKDTDCLNGGKCGFKGTKKFCNCLPGTQGDRCEIVNNCPNCRGEGAYCHFDVKNLNATCKCKDKKLEYDFYLRKCTWSCDEDVDCHNGGKCRYRGEHKFCHCLSGTQGPRCQIVDDCYSGRIRCRGMNADCIFNVKKLKAVCKCKDKNDVYDSRNERCRRIHKHHYLSEMKSHV